MNKKYLTPAEINALLESTRDQKFRGMSEQKLESNNRQSQLLKSYRNSPEFVKKVEQAMAKPRSPEHHANQQAAMKEAMENGNWRERHREGQIRKNKDPEYIKIRNKAAVKRAQDPKWIKNQKAGIEKIKKDPVWRRKNLLTNGTKPCLTPWGYFEGPNHAVQHPDAPVKYDSVRRYLKIGKPGYKVISWAEYDEIMGITGLPQTLDKS